MKLKKILALVLCVTMILSTMSFSVFANDEAVAEIGDVEYTSLQEALNFAGAAGAGSNTVKILKDIDLTDVDWTPVKVDGYHGADIVTVNGNNKTIKGLSAPLFAGGFAGGSGIVINDLTISESNIVSANTQGSGAFVECADSMDEITLTNCHLTRSIISGSRTGGLVGWTAGYNNVNDGPVKSYITIEDCSVVGCEIYATGSVGAIVGHSGGNAWTFTNIENCTINDNIIKSEDTGSWRAGIVVGTANVGEQKIKNITASGNTVIQNDKSIPEGQTELIGRFVPGDTGALVINDVPYTSDLKPYAVKIGGTYYKNLKDAAQTAKDGDVIELSSGEYSVQEINFRTVTVKAAEGADVVIDVPNKGNSLPHTDSDANVTFEGVTLDFLPNGNYNGLQYNTVTCNNCTINGQMFLYSYTFDTFNNCTFVQDSANSYNVWTYSAKVATFNDCKFESVGKSVLVYDEGTTATTINVVDCEFVASAPADGKAAIEISTYGGPAYVTIDDKTTAEGFDAGSVSGNSLWNNKDAIANPARVSDSIVKVADEVVYAKTNKPEEKVVAIVDNALYTSFADAVNDIKNNSTMIILEGEYDAALEITESNVTVIASGEVTLTQTPKFKGSNYYVEGINFVYNDSYNNLGGTGKFVDCDFTANVSTFRYCYAGTGTIEFNGCNLNAGAWAIHFDQAGGLDLVFTDCDITGRVALGSDLGSLTATGTSFNGSYINIWGTVTGATFDDCEFNNVPYIFTGYDLDNTVAFNDCTTNDEDGIAGLIYGGIKDANAEIKIDGEILTRVAKIGDDYYKTIEQAIEAAQDGDIITILAGEYKGFDIPATKNNLTFVGETGSTGASRSIENLVTIKTLDTGIESHNGGIFVGAENTTFKNLNFTAGTTPGARSGWMSSSLGNTNGDTGMSSSLKNLTVENCNFTGSGAYQAIWTNQGNITLKNTTITNYNNGIDNYAIGADQKVVIENSEITDVYNAFHTGEAADGAQIVVTETDIDSEVINVGGAVAVTVEESTIKNAAVTTYASSTFAVSESALYDTTYAVNENATGSITLDAVYANNVNELATNAKADNIAFNTYYPEVKDLGTGNTVAVPAATDAIYVKFVKADVDTTGEDSDENADLYNINLVATDDRIINRLNSVDLTFALSNIANKGMNVYEIIASNEEVAINGVDGVKNRYEFHYNGKDGVKTDSANTITIGQVKVTGYGTYSFGVAKAATNVAHATTVADNLVDTFVPGGVLADGTKVGDFDVTTNFISDVIAVPTRTLTINLDFPNAVNKNVAGYQDMKVVVSGGDLDKDIEIALSNAAQDEKLTYAEKADAKYTVAVADGYEIVLTDVLAVNNAYTVTVSGAGYRTARYTVTMTEDKALRFWNNVMDEAQFVEIGKDSSKVNVTFLAGDIVKDNNINIYDLSAVVSYFGQKNDTTAYSNYAKYDLNRDGVIDSKDVAYVLVSWNN